MSDHPGARADRRARAGSHAITVGDLAGQQTEEVRAEAAARLRRTRPAEGWAAPRNAWGPDVLGEGFEARTIVVQEAAGDSPEQVATLVRYRPEHRGEDFRPRFTALGLHGWNDYFFHWEVAELVDQMGGAFYAVDLRNYGRSLREGDLHNFIDDLDSYEDELDTAFALIDEECGEVPRFGFAHSTGGLVMSLWAARRPGLLRGLAMNSPWLETIPLQGLTKLTATALSALAKRQPTHSLWSLESGRYERVLTGGAQARGMDPLDMEDPFDLGWDLEPTWRHAAAPVYAGWVAAVLRGQAQVAEGVNVTCPILVLSAARSSFGIGGSWASVAQETLKLGRRPQAHQSDIVLDVTAMRRRALDLGPAVTCVAIDGAIHDVFASAKPVRARALQALRIWLGALLDSEPGEPPSD